MTLTAYISTDQDANGNLTEEELGNALAKCGFSLPSQRLTELFREMDTDGDDAVLGEEKGKHYDAHV